MNHRVRMAAAQIEQDAPFLTMASRRVADLLVHTVARRTERSGRAAEPQPHRGRVASSAGRPRASRHPDARPDAGCSPPRSARQPRSLRADFELGVPGGADLLADGGDRCRGSCYQSSAACTDAGGAFYAEACGLSGCGCCVWGLVRGRRHSSPSAARGPRHRPRCCRSPRRRGSTAPRRPGRQSTDARAERAAERDADGDARPSDGAPDRVADGRANGSALGTAGRRRPRYPARGRQ